MDINCTNNCIHQKNGKCSLNTMPTLIQLVSFSNESNCHHYQPFR
ncbi:MAG: hydroxymyristoyl-ACP dehydratase [Defluviitaleaceae bacterium]|nr:hydroxymyristoyl-ACP dehydratase [Defluviitaleaceae bacterium]